MIVKYKGKRANDAYIVGTFAWAMTQAKAGRDMHRRAWSKFKHYSQGDAVKFTNEDRKALDWETFFPTLPIDQPDVFARDTKDSNSNGWFGWTMAILLVAGIVAFVVYMSGHPVLWK